MDKQTIKFMLLISLVLIAPSIENLLTTIGL